MKKSYRPNVAAIVKRPDGLILIAQRSDFPDSWQFPQGGIDPGESPEEALHRELLEETSIPPSAYYITSRSGPYYYDFPRGISRHGFHGQEQYYFICTLTHNPSPSLLSPEATCGEFLAFRWVPPNNFPISLAHPMKQEVYRKVLHAHFGINNFS